MKGEMYEATVLSLQPLYKCFMAIKTSQFHANVATAYHARKL